MMSDAAANVNESAATESAAMTLDERGWCAAARAIASPNFTPRPSGAAVQLIVIHNISLPAGVFGGDDIIHLFTNTLDINSHPSYKAIDGLHVAAHFLIRRDGALLQFVSCDDAAHHAGESHWRGRAHCNDFSIGIELEGTDAIPYEDAQYEKLLSLLRLLLSHYPHAQLAGHSDIAPARKTDPGEAFDWQRIFSTLGDKYDGRA